MIWLRSNEIGEWRRCLSHCIVSSANSGLGFLHSNLHDGIPQQFPLCERTHYFLVQTHHMSTPRIRFKPDRALDAVAERDKLLRPIFRIRDMILKQENETIRIGQLEVKRWELGINMKNITVKGFMKRFPNIFNIYTNPRDLQPWCRLTKELMELVAEEKKIHRDQEPQLVDKLKKLLMMSKDRRISLEKLEYARRVLGLPDDFATRLVPNYPQIFRLVVEGPSPHLELVDWEETLAISTFEKKVKEEARKKGRGEIETRDQPLGFNVSYSPGMALRKKNLEILADWQKLPYISPYQDWSLVQKGTLLSDKRVVALLHEILCLTVEKKLLLGIISRFREEYGLPQNVGKLFNRYPGIFYLSLRGAIKTIILREGYRGSDLIDDHPLVLLKVKYARMVREGPRLRTHQTTLKEQGEESSGTEGNAHFDEGIDEKPQEPGNDEDCFDSSGDGSDVDDTLKDDFNDKEGAGFERLSLKASRRANREIW